MIHIATVHYQTDKWIALQLRYIKKHIPEEYRVYAFLDGEAAKHKDKFYYACLESIQDQGHAKKLNILADIISFAAADDDILIFLDGDAFPISNIAPFIREKISSHKLIAIQRIENCGDIQPHPAFCATTVGFWEDIKGTWKSGYEWANNRGNAVSDIGGNLLRILNDSNVMWLPLLRTSQLTGHPLWFGIYGNLIYHHGAGFRIPVSRYDEHETNFLLNIYYNILIRLPYNIRKRLRFRNLFFKQNIKMSDKIYYKILSIDYCFEEYFSSYSR